jgi:hypothetical protein
MVRVCAGVMTIATIVCLGSHLNMLDGVLGDELMPLADLIDPVHKPFDFAYGGPGKVSSRRAKI